jgi:hypothetical protein
LRSAEHGHDATLPAVQLQRIKDNEPLDFGGPQSGGHQAWLVANGVRTLIAGVGRDPCRSFPVTHAASMSLTMGHTWGTRQRETSPTSDRPREA